FRSLRRLRSVLHRLGVAGLGRARTRRPSHGRGMSTREDLHLFVSFPEELVERPMIYEIVKRFDVVPNLRRANVEPHSGWTILELSGAPDSRHAAVAYLEILGCTVNRMEGDVVAG